ncbi:hypothetical protein TNCV_3491771 [Trichonephila clavipes]|nr:hypothetical protein TNCV_3491771 [Trichonephila clavipes]
MTGEMHRAAVYDIILSQVVCTPSHDKTRPIFSVDQEPVHPSFTWFDEETYQVARFIETKYLKAGSPQGFDDSKSASKITIRIITAARKEVSIELTQHFNIKMRKAVKLNKSAVKKADHPSPSIEAKVLEVQLKRTSEVNVCRYNHSYLN